MRYIHERTDGDGIQKMMAELENGGTLDDAIAATGGWADESALFAELGVGTTFEDFVNDEMNLLNMDNGALGGLDADGGEQRVNTMQGLGTGSTAGSEDFLEFFVSDDNDFDNNDFSVTNFNDPQFEYQRLERYDVEVNGAGGRSVGLQVGADDFEVIAFNLGTFSVENLGLDQVGLVDRAQFSVIAVDDALRIVDKQRALFGAVQNRLGHAIANLGNIQENAAASRSRIRDTNFAAETATLVQRQLQAQAATSVLAQANQQWQGILSLLG